MNKSLFFYVVIVTVLFSCSKNENQAGSELVCEESLKYRFGDIKKELNKALEHGDFDSYNKVSNYYILSDDWIGFYYYAQLMANKHNCPEAHYHIHYFLTQELTIEGINMYSNDLMTNNLSLYHLLKSYELGYKKSENKIRSIFKNKPIPSAKDFFYYYSLNRE